MKKKFLSLALALAMLLSLVACGGNNNAPADSTPTPADTTEPADTTTPDDTTEPEVTLNYKDLTHDDLEIHEMVLGEFTDDYEEALAETNKSMRFAKMAVAEAKMLQQGIMVPTSSNGGGRAISHVVPGTVTGTLWGTDKDRYYKALVVDTYTDAEGNVKENALLRSEHRTAIKEEWKTAKDTMTEAEWYEWLKNYLAENGYTLKDTYGYANYSSEPQSFDELATSMAADHEVLVNTYDGLMEYNVLNQQVPALAESYEESADGLTYTFHIREGAVWTDSQGREVAPVCADDWVAGLQHALDSPGNVEYLVSGVIKGVAGYLDGTITDFSEVGVQAVDDHTLVYTLEQPTSYFMTLLSYSIFAPMSRTYYESQGGTFGANADPGDYASDTDHIAYCGPYLITNYTPKNTIVFKASESYWNKDAVQNQSIVWYYNDGTDVMKYYNDCIAGIIVSAGINDSTIVQAQADGNFDDYVYVGATDASSFMGWFNLNRGVWHNYNDTSKAVSEQDEDAQARAHAAMLNQNFRLAMATGFDRATHNAQSKGEATKYNSLTNCFTPGTFVTLEEDVTIDGLGTFPAGTRYGEIMQAQMDKDGFQIKVWDPTADDGIGSSSGFDGWYNPALSKEYMDKAVEELAELGMEVSAENPVQIDIPYPDSVETFANRAQVFKKSIEENTEGRIQVNLLKCGDMQGWHDAAYWPETGAEMNGDYLDDTGWSPDFGDPSTYLGTLYINGDGSMFKNIGLTL